MISAASAVRGDGSSTPKIGRLTSRLVGEGHYELRLGEPLGDFDTVLVQPRSIGREILVSLGFPRGPDVARDRVDVRVEERVESDDDALATDPDGQLRWGRQVRYACCDFDVVVVPRL